MFLPPTHHLLDGGHTLSGSNPELGYAAVHVKPRQTWLPEFIAGRTLDPVTYQTPPPFKRLTVYYALAGILNPGNGTGVFARLDRGLLWTMVGITSGPDAMRDNNDSEDITSRIAVKPAKGFELAGIYRQGQQPTGYRKIYGGDATLDWKALFFNAAYNRMDFVGRQEGGWALGMIRATKWLQFVGMLEEFQKSDESRKRGYTAGVNVVFNDKALVRFNVIHQPYGKRQLALLFQHIF